MFGALVLTMLLAQDAPVAEPPPAEAPPAETPPAETPPAPAPAEIAPPKRYGDQGTSHGSVILALGSGSGGVRYAAGGEYGYFVLPGVAPGAQLLVTGGSGVLTTTLALANLRLVPLRLERVALFIVGRAGRLFISEHSDGWAAGGDAGLIYFMGARTGLQVSYQVLKLFPESFCADLAFDNCLIQGLQLGFAVGF